MKDISSYESNNTYNKKWNRGGGSAKWPNLEWLSGEVYSYV